MEIVVADKAGFCFGVSRAVDIAYNNTGKSSKVCTYGMLIHNNDVISDLTENGVGCVENINDIPENSSVIIRAHGISEAEHKRLEEKNVNIIDATCPYVKKIHNIVKEEYSKGKYIYDSVGRCACD